MKEQNVGLHQV